VAAEQTFRQKLKKPVTEARGVGQPLLGNRSLDCEQNYLLRKGALLYRPASGMLHKTAIISVKTHQFKLNVEDE
jgi:hypothetical protein